MRLGISDSDCTRMIKMFETSSVRVDGKKMPLNHEQLTNNVVAVSISNDLTRVSPLLRLGSAPPWVHAINIDDWEKYRKFSAIPGFIQTDFENLELRFK